MHLHLKRKKPTGNQVETKLRIAYIQRHFLQIIKADLGENRDKKQRCGMLGMDIAYLHVSKIQRQRARPD